MSHDEPRPTERSESSTHLDSPPPIAKEFEGARFDLWISEREEKDEREIHLARERVSAIRKMAAHCGPDDLVAYQLLRKLTNSEMLRVTAAIEQTAQRVRSTKRTSEQSTGAYRYRRALSKTIPRLCGRLDDVLGLALEIIDQIEKIQAANQPTPAEPAQPGEPTE